MNSRRKQSMQDGEFAGKRVVLTGAAGVFGGWMARAFAERGAVLCLSDSRAEPLNQLIDRLSAGTGEHIRHVTNLEDPASIESLVRLVEERWSAPDILVNNAGIYPNRLLLEMPLKEWNGVMDVNLTAPFLLTQGLARQMVKGGIAGSIVNITSGAAYTTSAGAGHYSTSKAGLAMLTRAFALELSPHRIRVNAVSPGFAPGSEVSPLADTYVEAMKDTIPLGRTSGPKDAPEAVLFLCSESASYITGTTVTVDGGRSAGNLRLSAAKNH